MPPDGYRHLADYLDHAGQHALLAELRAVLGAAPLYPTMPRTGKAMSVPAAHSAG